jgi:hypothetical protein
MSLSRSPTWTHLAGSSKSAVDWRRFFSQRTLSFCSIGTHVGFIFFLSAAVPLSFYSVQNLTAGMPSGRPSRVTARLECISSPQTEPILARPTLSLPLLTREVNPDLVAALPLMAEFRRVLNHQDRACGRCAPTVKTLP